MLENTKQEISNFKKNLRLFMKRLANWKTIKNNEEATKLILEKCECKKFNYLKHNPQKKPIAIAEDNTEQQQKSYWSAVKSNGINKPAFRKQSKTNL